MENPNSKFTKEELVFIEKAAKFFEDPNLLAKGLNVLSHGIEKTQALLPEKAKVTISKAVKVSLEKAVFASSKTITVQNKKLTFSEAIEASKSTGRVHTTFAGALGGVSGFFGLVALPIELPITTLVMLRSILDTAQKFGLDITLPEVQLECVYVFSMGSDSPHDDQAMSAYYSSRFAFERLAKEASVILGAQTAKQILAATESGTSNALIRFISEVAAVFEIRITKKLLAQSVPVAGALAGATINSFFADYFKSAAQFHFGLRNLESEKGREQTQLIFDQHRSKYSKKK